MIDLPIPDLPLAKRDRVAIEAGLSQLRLWNVHTMQAKNVAQREEYAETAVHQAAAALDDIGNEDMWRITRALTNRRGDRLVAPPRLLRVRLALLLRALLRADRNDFGPCAHFAGVSAEGARLEMVHRPHAEHMLGWCFGRRCYTPLWESAPAHGATR